MEHRTFPPLLLPNALPELPCLSRRRRRRPGLCQTLTSPVLTINFASDASDCEATYLLRFRD